MCARSLRTVYCAVVVVPGSDDFVDAVTMNRSNPAKQSQTMRVIAHVVMISF